jgi:hypothetical protein
MITVVLIKKKLSSSFHGTDPPTPTLQVLPSSVEFPENQNWVFVLFHKMRASKHLGVSGEVCCCCAAAPHAAAAAASAAAAALAGHPKLPR